MGMLALYNLIGINQKEDQPMCIGIVKEMLDNAMAKPVENLKRAYPKSGSTGTVLSRFTKKILFKNIESQDV